ncbi:phage portal protein [Methylobacter sp. G7]|uniref:phage portal protein n=1 Tax=Methylobacter sp. G7 TaxID=3230117 RepID=UPI003D8093E4
MFDRAIEMYTALTTKPAAGKTSLFSFGDPEPILANNAMDYLGTFLDGGGEYYRPPVSLPGLVNLMGANAYHGPILHFKKNMILKWFEPSKLLSIKDLEITALNHLVTGNSYLQRLTNRFGKTTKLQSLPAIPMRRARAKDFYIKLLADGSKVEFKQGEVIHLLEPDLKQSIYGLPEYLGGIQSVLLGEASTLFRRKVLQNGNHMGYILVTTDADIDDADAKTIGEQVKLSKGPGNGRSMYLNIGKSSSREPVKVIPIGDIGTKDDFEAIKAITEREMLAMHRMQPGLSGIIPQNTGGFGDMEKTMRVYHELEVISMQQTFLELNEVMGEEVVKFKDPVWTV